MNISDTTKQSLRGPYFIECVELRSFFVILFAFVKNTFEVANISNINFILIRCMWWFRLVVSSFCIYKVFFIFFFLLGAPPPNPRFPSLKLTQNRTKTNPKIAFVYFCLRLILCMCKLGYDLAWFLVFGLVLG